MAQTETSREIDAILYQPTDIAEAVKKLTALHRDPRISKAVPFLMSVLRNDTQHQGIHAAELLMLIGTSYHEPRAYVEAEFRKSRENGVMAALALSHIGPHADWATDQILELWQNEFEPKELKIAPHEETCESLVHVFWIMRPPINRLLEPLVQALLHVERELAENIQDLIVSYGRSASVVLCEMFMRDPESQLNYFIWKILRRIGWAPPGAVRTLMQFSDKAPSRRDAIVFKIFDSYNDDLPNVLFDWFDDPRQGVLAGLAHSSEIVRMCAMTRLARITLPADERLQLLLSIASSRGSSNHRHVWGALCNLAQEAPETSEAVFDCLSKAYRDCERSSDRLVLWKHLDALQPRDPAYLLAAMLDDDEDIRLEAAELHWQKTGEVGLAIDVLSEIISRNGKGNHPWNSSLFRAFSVIGGMGANAISAVPMLEKNYRKGGYFAGIAVAALMKIGGCDQPLVFDFLDAYEPNEEDHSGLADVLWTILKRGSQSARLNRTLTRILFNGECISDSVNAATVLWAIDPQPGLLWKVAVEHWLHGNLYDAEIENLAEVRSFEYLRKRWPFYFPLLQEIAAVNRDMAIDHLTAALKCGIVAERINACRLLWELTTDPQAIVPTLNDSLTNQEYILSGRFVTSTQNGQYYEIPIELDVTIAATELLAQLGPAAVSSVPLLHCMLRSQKQIHQVYAADTLRSIGPNAISAIPELWASIGVSHDEQAGPGVKRIKDSAVEAICEITGCQDVAALKRVARNPYVWQRIREAVNREEIENYSNLFHDVVRRYAINSRDTCDRLQPG